MEEFDWGRAGIADRYQDIALAIRSIGYNFGNAYVQAFLDAYGLTAVDEAKVHYYQLMDEFF
jgi:aminoglycoside phosphotransferase